MHDVLPPSVKDPGVHASHAVAGVLSRSAKPAGQIVHAVSPVLIASEPDGHASHGVEGSKSRSARPASHPVHTVAPSGLYSPALQGPQTVAGSSSKSAVPAAHSSHVVAPVQSQSPLSHATGAQSYVPFVKVPYPQLTHVVFALLS